MARESIALGLTVVLVLTFSAPRAGFARQEDNIGVVRDAPAADQVAERAKRAAAAKDLTSRIRNLGQASRQPLPRSDAVAEVRKQPIVKGRTKRDSDSTVNSVASPPEAKAKAKAKAKAERPAAPRRVQRPAPLSRTGAPRAVVVAAPAAAPASPRPVVTTPKPSEPSHDRPVVRRRKGTGFLIPFFCLLALAAGLVAALAWRRKAQSSRPKARIDARPRPLEIMAFPPRLLIQSPPAPAPPWVQVTAATPHAELRWATPREASL